MSTQNPQYMVKKLVPQWKFFKLTSPEKYGSGPVGMMKTCGESAAKWFCAVVSQSSASSDLIINMSTTRRQSLSPTSRTKISTLSTGQMIRELANCDRNGLRMAPLL